MTSNKSRRIAMIIPGGIGTGRDNIGVPVLEQQVIVLAKDFDVVVFSLFQVNSDYLPEGFQIISVPEKRIVKKAWTLFTSFRRLNREKKFDVIHGFWTLPSGLFAMVLARYFKIPSVVSVLGGDAAALPAINYGQLRRRFPRMLAGWTLRNADEVTALTQYLVSSLANHGIKRPGIRIIPWGINNNQFPFIPVVVTPPLSFLHIANFSGVKDQLTLLKAFKIIVAKIDCHLTMIGEGPYENDLRNWIADNGLKPYVTIQAPVFYKDVPELYKKAMVLLHTSLSEGQSEVVTEAMSSGVVVCGTCVGLMYDLPDCCLAVAVEDYKALAAEVLKLVTDQPRLQVIRANARNWTHTHNLEWTVNKTAALYSELSPRKM